MFSSLMGRQGEKGQKGNTGDTGAKGDTGDTGAKGDTGEAGSADIVCRGNLSAPDYQIGDFTANGAWHTLDISSKIPEGTTHVRLDIGLIGSAIGVTANFINDDHANDSNRFNTAANVANYPVYNQGLISVSSTRKIRYKLNALVTTCDLSVIGWFL